MSKKECPSCAMKVDAKAEVCPVCAYEFPSSVKSSPLVAIILLLIFVLLGLGAWRFLF